MGSRKDDPVFNVKFVQLVESKPCLWNSTLPEYSKKDEIQKAWQEVANETKDTVRNCRERWRTIRSSFLRSLKLSRTSTGRGKRKYYLSKYLQFLIPFTRSRLKNSTTVIAQRKAAGNLQPMTRISNMPIVSSDETKDSSNSAEVAAIAEGDVMVTMHEGAVVGTFPMAQHATLPLPLPLPLPLNLQTIKQEKDVTSGSLSGGNMSQILPLQPPLEQQQHTFVNSSLANNLSIANNSSSNNNNNNSNLNNINNNNNNNDNCINNNNNENNNTNNPNLLNGSIANKSSNNNNNNNFKTANNNNTCNNSTVTNKSLISTNNHNNSNNNNNSSNNNNKLNITKNSLSHSVYPPPSHPQPTELHTFSTVDLTEFAEWLKSKNEYQRHCLMASSSSSTSSPDADQSFLNSLHPYLREMSGKQNRRFRQKVVALIDAVLDNTD